MRDERGEFTLLGLLVAMIIFGFVLGATLTLFGGSSQASRAAGERAEAADRARDGIDRMSKALRNLASPSVTQTQAIETASGTDLIFKTVAPVMLGGSPASQNLTNTKRVRYCLNATDPNRGRVYEQTQTWTTATPPAAPAASLCGTRAGWTHTEVLADRLTNAAGGATRPLFTYNAANAAANPTAISAIHMDLFVDPDPRSAAPETVLSSGVFLRNQNRRPTAAFTATGTASGIVLNGSASVDPDGGMLQYFWTVNGVAVGSADGNNITFTYPVSAPAADRTIQLRVVDSAGLDNTAPTQTVRA
jgi:type II secretory pathway pseudopilin PulG